MHCWKYEPDERMNMGGLVKSLDGGKTWEKVNEVSFLNDDVKESAKMLLNEDNNHQPIPNKIDPSKKINHSFTQVFPKEKDGYRPAKPPPRIAAKKWSLTKGCIVPAIIGSVMKCCNSDMNTEAMMIE